MLTGMEGVREEKGVRREGRTALCEGCKRKGGSVGVRGRREWGRGGEEWGTGGEREGEGEEGRGVGVRVY